MPPAADAALAPGEFSWTPEKSASGPVTILVSEPDKVVYVYRNGVEIGRSSVRTIEIKGLHIFSALAGRDDQGRSKWIRVDGKPAANDPNIAEMTSKAGIADAFITGYAKSSYPARLWFSPTNPSTPARRASPASKSCSRAR